MARKKIESKVPHPLVAIDLGSNGVRAMAAERTPEGLLHILGVEQSSRNVSVERGVVTSTSDASYAISESMRLLGNRINHPLLTKTFVALGGRQMKVVEVPSRRDQVHKREVPQKLLEEMDAECKQKIEQRYPTLAVLALIPYCYILDGVEQEEAPTAQQWAAKIEVKYTAFIGPKELEQKVIDSFLRTPKSREHIYARPDALMCALATNEDFRDGCAIIDMGAQTTTLTVFSEGKYVLNKVVAQGGYDITRDIEQLGINMQYAELLKCKYGCTMVEPGRENQCFRIPEPSAPNGIRVIRMGDMVNTIVARLEQMMIPLLDELSKYEQRIAVVYITGGASLLQGMEEYLKSLISVPVMYGSHAAWLTDDTPDEMCAPTYSSLVGTLILGALYRDEHPDVEPVHDLRKQFEKFKQTAQTSLIEIFTEHDNTSESQTKQNQ